jgi:hypothetical protein
MDVTSNQRSPDDPETTRIIKKVTPQIIFEDAFAEGD